MAVYPDRFVKGLQEDNPWWSSSKISHNIPDFKRSDFKYHISDIDKNIVKIIIGPRRIGKTTILYQIIDYLLVVKKIDPKSILFMSLDRPYFELLSQKVEDCIEFFEEKVLGRSIQKSDNTVYIFIDEAQYDISWARSMKQFMDLKKPIHCIVSGSSSTALFKDCESGAGRFHINQMVTMKFRDVLRLSYQENGEEIKNISYGLRESLIKAIKEKDISIYEKECNKILLINPDLKNKIVKGLDNYLLKGGYPEFYDKKKGWKEISRFYQQNVFDIILQKDIVNVFQIRYPEKVRNLFVVLAQNTASKLSRKKLGESIKMQNTNTVDSYIEALSEAFLVRYSTRFRKQSYPSTKEKKYYSADTGLRNAILGVTEGFADTSERGALIETAILNHLLRLAFHIDHKIRSHCNYWEDDKSERDIVLDLTMSCGYAIPIEVKNGQCGKEDVNKIRRTIGKIESPFGFVICKDQLGLDKNVMIIPAWLFMLSC